MSNAIFLKFDGVEGESTDSEHQGWIQIEGMAHHLAATIDRVAGTASGSHAAGATEHGDFTFTKALDKASLAIMAQCCSGKSFPIVEIDIMASTSGDAATPNQRILGIILEQVYIADISYSDSAGNPGRPSENISLNYRKITWTYSPYDNDGKAVGDITKYWDVSTNTGG
jgi:type VI secretion system secreted protein Hcp